MVVLASTIANYADAPWALLVKFPYPDLTFSVKAISLHPEFNKRAARDHYLGQAKELLPQQIIMDNDIATITLDTEIPELQPDRVQELTRALSLQLNISPQDLSGVMRAGDTGNILQKALSSGRNGVLNFFDERKVPFCRVLVKGGRIAKAVYQNLQNEYAICELMWRKPGGNFVLSMENLNWGPIGDIQMPTDQLANEANRRCNDLPRMLDALGGPNARYVKSRPQIDLNQINPQIRWVVEKIWPALDGGLPLTKLSERLGVDSWTAVQALWEMKHLGLVGQDNSEQFHRSGQLGAALTPGHDVDLKFWDPLTAFYLDDLSNLPVAVQGNYFGSNKLLNLSTLLHTMPLPHCKYGAAVIKDGRLIGVHNGKYTAVMQNPPPFPLSQMIWVGSLSEMSAKRIRATEMSAADSEEMAAIPSAGRGTMTGLKTRPHAILPPELTAPQNLEGETQAAAPSNEPEILQKFSKIQILGAGGGMFLIGLLMSMGAMMSPKPSAVPTPAAVNTSTSTSTASSSGQPTVSGADSMKQAVSIASFKQTALPPFVYTDTSKDTMPKPSFGLESEQANQKILFVVWPNPDVRAAVDSNTKTPPFIPLVPFEYGGRIDEGTSEMHNMYWKAWRYLNKGDKEGKNQKATAALIGCFTTNQPDKSILVVAYPYKGEGELDYKNTINTIERMFTETNSSESGTSSPAATQASAEEVQAYRQKVGESIKAAYKAPDGADRANKYQIVFNINSEGKIAKMETKYSSGMEDVDHSVEKAIQSKVPFPAPPKTSDGLVPMRVTVTPDEFTVDEP
jgi:outer membrane biosynthesis protein TonB